MKQTITREERALRIVAAGGIERINDTFFVPSESGNSPYPVTLGACGENCACKDRLYNKAECAHIKAAKIWAERDVYCEAALN